jgi:RES domain-containing protein
MKSWTGEVYRATTYDVPLWVNPNRRNGRWNIAYDGCTQYMCLDSEAPLAEMLRGEDLTTESMVKSYRVQLWQLRVAEGAIVDYSTFEKAEKAGFDADALVEDDHERCQAEAKRLKSLGARGLLSPSAALPGSVNLTLFGPRSPIAWNTTVKLASSIPTQRLSEGNAPAGLVHRVRFYGRPHSALVDYRLGAERLFD